MSSSERNAVVVTAAIALVAGACIGLAWSPAVTSHQIAPAIRTPSMGMSQHPLPALQPLVASRPQFSQIGRSVKVAPKAVSVEPVKTARGNLWLTAAAGGLAFSVASLALALWRRPRQDEALPFYYSMLAEAAEVEEVPSNAPAQEASAPEASAAVQDAVESKKDPAGEPQETETVVGTAENYGFETNTKQILDIVARSLYQDKEVFIRELISNASDAIEKHRYIKLISDKEIEEAPEPRLALHSDPVKNIFVIQDTGIGMTKEELVSNLGTIASSGSKQLIEKLKSAQEDPGDRVIGQFGVGFYSAFIVAKSVKVFTRSCQKGSKGYLWESEGHGDYSITEADGVAQGTKIIVELKDDNKEFSDDLKLEKIIQKYSNFISSPIFLNGKRINTVEALWRKNPKDVTEEQYTEFYKYVGNAYDKPWFKLHYRVDAPVDIKSILFIPEYNLEQPGRTRISSNVSLYCKKVLIQSKCPDLLPEWMRFVVGVVDSEDLPLNVSREGTQDSKAFKKLGKLVASRVLKWLADEADKDKGKYGKFFNEFGYFLKEGACMDQSNKAAVAKLLRFESSKLDAGEVTSFDEYIGRFAEGQERIYFLHAPSRQAALVSPYYEQLRKKGVEVLFMYSQLDEFLMSNLTEYKGHKCTSVENTDLDLEKIKSTEVEEEKETDTAAESLSPKQRKEFEKFLKKALAENVSDVKASTRLVDSPAVIAAGFEQATVYRHLKAIANAQGKRGFEGPMGKQSLEYNPKNSIIRRLYWLTRSADPEAQKRARLMAEQIYDNALIASGLLEDPRLMLSRLNTLLQDSMNDVVVGTEDDGVVTEVVETPAEPEPAEAEWRPTPMPDDEARAMADQALDDLNMEADMDRLLEETMRKNTAPLNADFGLTAEDLFPGAASRLKEQNAETAAEWTPDDDAAMEDTEWKVEDDASPKKTQDDAPAAQQKPQEGATAAPQKKPDDAAAVQQTQ